MSRSIALRLASVLLIASLMDLAGRATEAAMALPPNVGVKTNDDVGGQLMLTNMTGLPANDLEIQVYTKEGLPIQGLGAMASGFANTMAAFDPQMPGCVDVQFSGGTDRRADGDDQPGRLSAHEEPAQDRVRHLDE